MYNVVNYVNECRQKHRQLLCNTLATLNRRDDLSQLVQWAERKRLSGPLKPYQARLADEEIRLNRIAIQHPRLYRRARALHWLRWFISPTPRYYKGYAAKYRRSRLTTHRQKSYSIDKRIQKRPRQVRPTPTGG
jgi:hypothetical protein